MTTQPDFTKSGKRLTSKSIRATETLLSIEREQRDRDQSRLARALVIGLESGVRLDDLAISDDSSERNFLRRVLYHYEKERLFALTGLAALGVEFEDEQ
jgi:hypothetical protein